MKSKLLSIAVALLASFSLWVYVVTVVNQEVSNQPIENIAVTFSGADQIRADSNLVITDGADATVDLRVTCSRQTVTRLSSTNISIVVDVSRIREPGEYVGKLLPEAAAYLGLPADANVCTGCLDQAAGAVGVGNIRPGIFSSCS